tara:strand:+ start:458 stop:613 length:156 start_codon:yes stop_codon:yes gene_type:complete
MSIFFFILGSLLIINILLFQFSCDEGKKPQAKKSWLNTENKLERNMSKQYS